MVASSLSVHASLLAVLSSKRECASDKVNNCKGIFHFWMYPSGENSIGATCNIDILIRIALIKKLSDLWQHHQCNKTFAHLALFFLFKRSQLAARKSLSNLHT